MEFSWEEKSHVEIHIYFTFWQMCNLKKKENKTKQFLHQDGYIVFSVLVQISTKTQNHLSACY